MIAKQQTGRAIDHVRAFVFLLGSLLVGSLLVLLGFQLQGPAAAPPNWRGASSAARWGWCWPAGDHHADVDRAAAGLARAAGRRVELQQITLVMAYLVSGAWLGLAAGALVFGFGASFYDPGWFGAFARAIGFGLDAPGAPGPARSNAGSACRPFPPSPAWARARSPGCSPRCGASSPGVPSAGLRRDARPRRGGHRRLAAAAGQRAAHRRPAGQPAGGRIGARGGAGAAAG